MRDDVDGITLNFDRRNVQQHGRGEAFAIVRDLAKRAKPKVQAMLRRAGRTSETTITLLSDGEDGLRDAVEWFGPSVNTVWTGFMLTGGSTNEKASALSGCSSV